MVPSANIPLLAVDIGNSRTKFGLFSQNAYDQLPAPAATLSQPAAQIDFRQVDRWLAENCPARQLQWWIASVNRPACSQLIDWLRDRRLGDPVRLLVSFDLPLQVALPQPDMVGIDRLAGAVAANRQRPAGKPCVVIDLGTAITIDLIDPEGAFLGGAILPGIGMSARALHEFTDLLPLLDMETLKQPPAPVGTSTVDAMQSGLYWGAIGASRELIDRFCRAIGHEPHVLLTGGAAATVAPLIAPGAVYVPHLVLSGIALSVASLVDAKP